MKDIKNKNESVPINQHESEAIISEPEEVKEEVKAIEDDESSIEEAAHD